MEIQVAVAKIGKYATRESGDTFEMIERPHGGFSCVLADGQSSGRAAKAISNLVARKAISLLAEGIRDGAAARATHDYLYTHRQGKVQATLNILSVDLVTRTVVISRNSHCPVLVQNSAGLQVLDAPSAPIGIYRGTKPVITELAITPGTFVVVFTDGIAYAGERYGVRLDLPELVSSCTAMPECSAQPLADEILARAIELDQGRPSDDMSILVLSILDRPRADEIRRLHLSFPIPDV